MPNNVVVRGSRLVIIQNCRFAGLIYDVIDLVLANVLFKMRFAVVLVFDAGLIP